MRKSILLYFLFFIFTSSGVLSANANFEEGLLREQNVAVGHLPIKEKYRTVPVIYSWMWNDGLWGRDDADVLL